MPSLLDNPDATGSTQEMDTSASQGSTKRDGTGGREEQPRRQLPTNRPQSQARRRGPRIDSSSNQASQGRIQARPEEPQQADAQGNAQNAPDYTRTDRDGVGHTVGQSIEPRSRQHVEADANLRGKRYDKRSEDTLEVHRSYWRIWAWSSPFSREAQQWEHERHRE